MHSPEFQPTFEEFEQLATRGNLVPVWSEVLADLETPVSAFAKLRARWGEGDAWLLESVEGGENLARYSFLGVTARASFCSRDNVGVVRENGEERRIELGTGRDPLHIVEELMARFSFVPTPGLPRFCGGAVGFLGYDCVRFFEKLPDAPPDDRDLQDCSLILTDTVLIFDAVRHSIRVLNNAFIENGNVRDAYDTACEKIAETLRCLNDETTRPAPLPLVSTVEIEPKSNMTREQHEGAVQRAIDYIHAGDCVQIVPSQRFEVPLKTDAFTVYRALRHVSPAPYMFYLKLGDVELCGASPEVLVTEDNGAVTTRPIAGTRRRGATTEEDLALEVELLADPKEVSEHIMLVDLHRNDIGRVCEYGSVEVDEFMAIERYSHVMHIVSNIKGTLKKDKTAFDLLRASFPAGTLSGAPKIRAMQIIDELEPTRRGPYGGAIGYFSYSGNLDTCITLRTIVAKDGIAYIQAGGGVVADSVPSDEYEETRNKARAALRAIALAHAASEEN
ncbi:MAG TPA: anthranilate synthase component I [Abditibacteriaceae bacterium]|jgi:anthranilate synthase component 1